MREMGETGARRGPIPRVLARVRPLRRVVCFPCRQQRSRCHPSAWGLWGMRGLFAKVICLAALRLYDLRAYGLWNSASPNGLDRFRRAGRCRGGLRAASGSDSSCVEASFPPRLQRSIPLSVTIFEVPSLDRGVPRPLHGQTCIFMVGRWAGSPVRRGRSARWVLDMHGVRGWRELVIGVGVPCRPLLLVTSSMPYGSRRRVRQGMARGPGPPASRRRASAQALTSRPALPGAHWYGLRRS